LKFPVELPNTKFCSESDVRWPGERSIMKFAVKKVILLVVVAAAGLAVAMNREPDSYGRKLLERVTGTHHVRNEAGEKPRTFHVQIVPDRPETIQFSEESYHLLQIRTVEVKPAPPPEPLRLPGSLVLDPNRLVVVHTRFSGELVRIAMSGHNGSARPLRYGDRVNKGDVMGVVWSKDIGEKKSELVDAVSKLEADRNTLKALKSAAEGAVARIKIVEAQRNFDADSIALARADRTLRSWRLSEDEIQAVYQEAEDVRKGITDPTNDKSWAELEIRAPISGLIVEKNFNEGAMVDPDDALFQIADLSQLMVMAYVYEEDLPALKKLPPLDWKWKIDLKSDPHDKPIEGMFDLIGTIIDSDSHTGVVMGWVDNFQANHAAGQFITATVELTADSNLVVIPTSALIEEGGSSYVFVETNADRREFTRRKMVVTRRGRQTVFVCGEAAAAERGCAGQSLSPGDKVVVTMVLELSAELDLAKSRSAEQEP
jgi:cobalt-zinc-cadmium efflux system membrane fusion protein